MCQYNEEYFKLIAIYCCHPAPWFTLYK